VRPVLTFEPDYLYVEPRQSVLFFARIGGRRLRCYVERAALVAHCEAEDEAHEAYRHCLRAYHRNRDMIQAVARALIESSALAPECVVVVSAVAIARMPETLVASA
jgi:hypothetical protein